MGTENSTEVVPKVVERCQDCGGIILKDHSMDHLSERKKISLTPKVEDVIIASKVEDVIIASKVEDVIIASKVEDVIIASKVEDIEARIVKPIKTSNDIRSTLSVSDIVIDGLILNEAPNIPIKENRSIKKRPRNEEAIEGTNNKRTKLDHNTNP